MEYLIKLLVWIICWIGGAFVLNDATKGVGSSYFVFSLALLMEFGPQIKEKKECIVRIIHWLFCFAICSILVCSAIILLSAKYYEKLHKIMYVVSIIVIVYMCLDCSILWIFKEDDDIPCGANEIALNNDRVEKFSKNLTTGNLGTISKR